MRDYEPRPLWTSLPITRCVCLLLQDLVQSCSRGGGGGTGSQQKL
jgi:hypothetical protein